MRLPDWIDVRVGIYGGLAMGGAVALINADYGPAPAAIAGLKQGVYTFIFGGAVLKLCAQIASRAGPRARVLTAAVVLPSFITSSAFFLVHNLRGTPEPLLSCIPVVATSPPGFAFWAWRTRRGLRDQGDASRRIDSTGGF